MAEREVGEQDAVAQPRALVERGQAGHHHQRVDRADPEHHQRVAKQPVAEPAAPALGPVLVDGQGRDVADPAPVEVARRAVMDGVVVAPVRERLPDQQGAEAPEPAIGALGGEERAVAAVVKDDEDAKQKAPGGDRQGKGQPDRDVERQVHRDDQRQVGHDRGRDVERAAPEIRLLVGRHLLRPVRFAHRPTFLPRARPTPTRTIDPSMSARLGHPNRTCMSGDKEVGRGPEFIAAGRGTRPRCAGTHCCPASRPVGRGGSAAARRRPASRPCASSSPA